MSESLHRPQPEKTRYRLRVTASDPALDNALWNLAPAEDMPEPLYLFSVRSQTFHDTKTYEQYQGYKHRISFYDHAELHYRDPQLVAVAGRLAVRFAVQFGVQERATVVASPFVLDDTTKSPEEEQGRLSFLYSIPESAREQTVRSAMAELTLLQHTTVLRELRVVPQDKHYIPVFYDRPPTKRTLLEELISAQQ